MPLLKPTKKSNSIIKSMMTLTGLSIITNVFVALFFVYLGRRLGPESFSEFGSLMSIYYGAVFVSTIVGIVVIRYIAYFRAKGQVEKIKRLIQTSMFRVIIAGGICFFSVAILSPLIITFLKIDKVYPVIMMAFVIWIHVVLQNQMSILNGHERFTKIGGYRVLQAVATLLFAVILVELGAEKTGPFIALAAATLLSVILIHREMAPLFKRQVHRIGQLGINRYILHALIISVTLGVMVNIDVILVKFYFEKLHAGWYVAAATLAKTIFHISTGVVLVSFPRTSLLHSQGKPTLSVLRDSLKYAIGISSILFAFFTLFPSTIANLLFGSDYVLTGLLQPLALAMLFLAPTTIILMYEFALRRFRLLYVAVPFMMLEILVLQLTSHSLYLLVWGLAFVMMLQFIAVIYIAREHLLKLFKKRKLPKVNLESLLRLKESS